MNPLFGVERFTGAPGEGAAGHLGVEARPGRSVLRVVRRRGCDGAVWDGLTLKP